MKHYHKYQKVLLGKKRDYLVYKCMIPNCKHYTSPELVPGKIALCFRCNQPFVVKHGSVRRGKEMLKLHCEPCTRRKGKVVKYAESKATHLLQSLGFEVPDQISILQASIYQASRESSNLSRMYELPS